MPSDALTEQQAITQLVKGTKITDGVNTLAVNPDGSIKAEVEVGEITIGDVVIKDPSTTDKLKVNSDGSINVNAGALSPETIYGDELTLPDTLPDQEIKDGVVIKAKDTNDDPVSVNGFMLEPGESVGIRIDNLSKVLVTGKANDVVYYIGS